MGIPILPLAHRPPRPRLASALPVGQMLLLDLPPDVLLDIFRSSTLGSCLALVQVAPLLRQLLLGSGEVWSRPLMRALDDPDRHELQQALFVAPTSAVIPILACAPRSLLLFGLELPRLTLTQWEDVCQRRLAPSVFQRHKLQVDQGLRGATSWREVLLRKLSHYEFAKGDAMVRPVRSLIRADGAAVWLRGHPSQGRGLAQSNGSPRVRPVDRL